MMTPTTQRFVNHNQGSQTSSGHSTTDDNHCWFKQGFHAEDFKNNLNSVAHSQIMCGRWKHGTCRWNCKCHFFKSTSFQYPDAKKSIMRAWIFVHMSRTGKVTGLKATLSLLPIEVKVGQGRHKYKPLINPLILFSFLKQLHLDPLWDLVVIGAL